MHEGAREARRANEYKVGRCLTVRASSHKSDAIFHSAILVAALSLLALARRDRAGRPAGLAHTLSAALRARRSLYRAVAAGFEAAAATSARACRIIAALVRRLRAARHSLSLEKKREPEDLRRGRTRGGETKGPSVAWAAAGSLAALLPVDGVRAGAALT